MKKKHLSALCSLLLMAKALVAAQDLVYYSPDEEEAARRMAERGANISEEDATMAARSRIDWSKKAFTSDVSLDIVKAGIPMPSGKSSAVNKIQMELPILVKDTLLSIYADDTRTLADLVLEGTLTLDELTRIIDNSHHTPASFENGGTRLQTEHNIKLQEIGSLLVKHHTPYTQRKPIQRIASRAYSGIIIDARGVLPVQGEFVSSEVQPCLFPKIWDEDMTLVYERNMVDPATAKEKGIVSYAADKTVHIYEESVGKDPLWITAKKVYGVYRCDPVISHDDYLRITTVAENLKLLQEGKVLILLGKDQLAHRVSAPERSITYYRDFVHLKHILEDEVPEVTVEDTIGTQITLHDLHFIADSSQLLPSERERIGLVAAQIKDVLSHGEWTIMVDGHTADVNKPTGQLTLSIQRAQAIVNELVDQGIPPSLFTYRGFGGTMPIADNSTDAGRAANRRVVITLIPKEADAQRR